MALNSSEMDASANTSNSSSASMFAQDEEVSQDETWIGTPLPEITRRNINLKWNLPPRPATHLPHCEMASHCWDNEFVRMPFSPKNLFPVKNDHGQTVIKNRWSLIKDSLMKEIRSSQDLEKCILSYNNYKGNFVALHHYFNCMDEEAHDYFFEKLLPKIVALALELPELLPSSLLLLKRGKESEVTLSKRQIASLLANAFFCTFPRRNTTKPKSEYSTYPDINFNRFFEAYERNDETFSEKMKCITNYFRRVCEATQTGQVTFKRMSLKENSLPNWRYSNLPFSSMQLHISHSGTIEENGIGLLQVDFANKYIGGGVLGLGCVQEEIRFVVCTELIVTRLFTEVLGPTEALLVIGVEQYNTYRGYADTFEWTGNYEDLIPRDEYNRVKCCLVAIDALYFHKPSAQYTIERIKRELDKAYAGYHIQGLATAVATGNWGCGAFRGDPHLKSLIQLMACRVASKDMVYFTFGDRVLKERLYHMFTVMVEHNATVGLLYGYLKQFCESGLPGKQLYEFLEKKFTAKDLIAHLPKRRKISETESPEGMDDTSISSSVTEYSEVLDYPPASILFPKVEKPDSTKNEKPTPGRSILLEKLAEQEAAQSLKVEQMDVDQKTDEGNETNEIKVKRKITDYFQK